MVTSFRFCRSVLFDFSVREEKDFGSPLDLVLHDELESAMRTYSSLKEIECFTAFERLGYKH